MAWFNGIYNCRISTLYVLFKSKILQTQEEAKPDYIVGKTEIVQSSFGATSRPRSPSSPSS